MTVDANRVNLKVPQIGHHRRWRAVSASQAADEPRSLHVFAEDFPTFTWRRNRARPMSPLAPRENVPSPPAPSPGLPFCPISIKRDGLRRRFHLWLPLRDETQYDGLRPLAHRRPDGKEPAVAARVTRSARIPAINAPGAPGQKKSSSSSRFSTTGPRSRNCCPGSITSSPGTVSAPISWWSTTAR